MDFEPSPRIREMVERVRVFVRERILPAEARHLEALAVTRHGGDWSRWTVSPEVEHLKREARALGLWNLFLPDPELGAGLSTVEYAPLAEEMGWSFLAPEVMNCNAPDTGNMEVLWKYGTDEQKERWLEPLLEGRIRSVFCMTEPDVASSDATNVRTAVTLDGDEVVVDGVKWWTTGLGHPQCEVAIVLGLTDPQAADRHRRHSMVLVPIDADGVTIRRMLPVFGEYDEPYGHGEVEFEQVRVPRENLIAGPGRGFEVAQGRLGPGRIHHCMRAVGAAERALELMVRRGLERVAFGKPLVDLGGNRERIADLRLAIDQARLLTLHAAWRLDELGPHGAAVDVSAIKIVAPSVLERVVDEAIQMFGGAGLSHDTPLPSLLAMARMLRLADGPDAVHRAVVAKAEIARHQPKRAERVP
jgi:acyl-CoA dehydrogenase